jgi:predicted transcriptional regulator
MIGNDLIFDLEQDGKRLSTQLQTIASLMESAHQANQWLSLAEIEQETGYPQASCSAQLRHLRKEQFGGHRVEKRRRGGQGGTYEYRVFPKVSQ